MHTSKLLARFPIISDQVDEAELRVLMEQLEGILRAHITGSIVEFGCYVGTTSLFIRRLLDAYSWTGQFHVYDSFAGLPEKTSQDDSPAGLQFQAGELAASKRDFITQFRKSGLQPPVIHKAWFYDLTPKDIPHTIVFAFLDGDYYESIRDSLRLITPKLAPGAVIIVDDYAHEALPGAARAVDEWLQTNPCRLQVQSSLAILTACK